MECKKLKKDFNDSFPRSIPGKTNFCTRISREILLGYPGALGVFEKACAKQACIHSLASISKTTQVRSNKGPNMLTRQCRALPLPLLFVIDPWRSIQHASVINVDARDLEDHCPLPVSMCFGMKFRRFLSLQPFPLSHFELKVPAIRIARLGSYPYLWFEDPRQTVAGSAVGLHTADMRRRFAKRICAVKTPLTRFEWCKIAKATQK